jgi:hypothetical protein
MKKNKPEIEDDLRPEYDLKKLKGGVRGKYAQRDKKVLDDKEIKVQGIEALNDALGPSAALRFLSLINRERTDYVKISRRLYQGMTIDQIFNQAKKVWKETAHLRKGK